jgi:hypothetical protein
VASLSWQSGSPAELLRAALLLCRDSPPGLGDAIEDDKTEYLDIVAHFVALLRKHRTSIDIDASRVLRECVPRAFAFVNDVMFVVHAFAQALEDAFYEEIAVEMALSGEMALDDGALFLRPRGTLYDAMKQLRPPVVPRLGARAEHRKVLSSEPAQTRHAALFVQPAGLKWRVRVDMRRYDALEAALPGVPKVTAIHPFSPSNPVHVPAAVDGRVFGVGPTDQEAAWKTAKELLATAAECGARVAVMPELSVGRGVVPELAGERVPALVLTGSQHLVDEAGAQRNRARLHLNGEVVLIHDKVVRFRDLHDEPVIEDIKSGDAVTVLLSRSWGVVPLICADVNDPTLSAMLVRLGANLVLVGAMTGATGFFNTDLEHITASSQGLAVWVNEPTPQGRYKHTSAFYLPGKKLRRKVFRDRGRGPSVRSCDWTYWLK